MKLADIFSQLTFGELKQIGMGGFDDGAIQPDNYREVINHINLGLEKLYARFPLSESSFLLRTIAGKTSYKIDINAAVSRNGVNAYIIDTLFTPFADDVSQIKAIKDSQGNTLPFNDVADLNSVFLSGWDTISIPWAEGGEDFHVHYTVRPTYLVVPNPSVNLDLTKDVPIPRILLEPLLLYVEYRVMKAKGGEAGLAQAALAKRNYEAMCLEIEGDNTLNSTSTMTNLKLHLNGWV